ncbi:hypothetical protein BC936DRAFT_137252, partial [Jimgerdemannia flammicorona]
MKFAALTLALVAFVATTVVATPIAVSAPLEKPNPHPCSLPPLNLPQIYPGMDCNKCNNYSDSDTREQCSEDCWCMNNPKECRAV